MRKTDFKSLFIKSLKNIYDTNECQAIFRLYIEYKLQIPLYQYFADTNQEIDITPNIQEDLKKLADGKPIQHLIGETEFYGRSFLTDSRALIPRRETEELVYHILHETTLPAAPTIMDFCTGSGIIAITLAKEIAEAKVDATDLSTDALALAQENAKKLEATVRFVCADLLKTDHLEKKYDLIVSNPPYIPQSEQSHLHPNVINYEPAMALFVPDENPILFYEKIAQLAHDSLQNNGYLYLETHENFHKEITKILNGLSFKDIQSRNDWQKKARFVSARK